LSTAASLKTLSERTYEILVNAVEALPIDQIVSCNLVLSLSFCHC
jgi:hypothetical protein